MTLKRCFLVCILLVPSCFALLSLFGVAAAAPVQVNDLTALRNNNAQLMVFLVKMASDVGVVGGLGLIFTGIFSLYNSQVKKGSGGKPASHGISMFVC